MANFNEIQFRNVLALLVKQIYPNIEEIPIAWDGTTLDPDDRLFNWRDKTYTEPTRKQLEEVYIEWQVESSNLQAKQKQAIEDVYTVVNSAAGIHVSELTVTQQNALMGVLLMKAGGLDLDLKILSLDKWIS